MEEINEDREEHNKKPFGEGKKDNKETTVIGSASIPTAVFSTAVTERFLEIKEVVADAAYKTQWIYKNIIDDERIPVMLYKGKCEEKNFFNL